MEGFQDVRFLVNGQICVASREFVEWTLANYLRKILRLTGTKIACSQGGCGSCTVTCSQINPDNGRLEHRAINSCITKVIGLQGKAITTVEGLGTPKDQHPIQERIHKSHGSQCGFCTPGMVMSMHSMVKSNATPDIEDVARCLQGNLCRCTGYRPILEGFETFCEKPNPGNQKCEPDEEILDLKPEQYKPYNSKCDPKVTKEQLMELNQHFQFVTPELTYYLPASLEELQKLQNSLGNFTVVAGGTGSFQMKYVPLLPSIPAINVNGVKELHAHSISDGLLKLGSAITLTQFETILSTHESIKNSPTAKVFLEALTTLASPQIRNVATLGGSLLWGHPSSDLMPIYLTLGCHIEISGPQKTLAVVKLDSSWSQSVLKDTEIIVGLSIPILSDSERVAYYRQSKRKEFDLSIATACFWSNSSSWNIHIGGVEPLVPMKDYPPITQAQALKAILEAKSSNATEEEILEALSADVVLNPKAPGNTHLLRLSCLLDFTQRFLGTRSPSKVTKKQRSKMVYTKPDPGEQAVTRPIPHMWGAEQACGTAVYVDDTKPLQDELQLVLVQSTKAHARVTRIDFSRALAMDGVHGVISAADILKEKNLWGLIVPDEAIFAQEEIVYHGQIIAGIACDTIKIGNAAKSAVTIEYEDLEPVLSIGKAKAMKSTLLANQCLERLQGSSKAPTKSVAGSIKMSGQEHFYLETHSVLVEPIGEKDEIIVTLSTQEPSNTAEKLSSITDIPLNRFQVKSKRTGGGFGGKERMHNSILATLAAIKFGRSIRLIFSRKLDMEVTGHRHELEVDFDMAVDDDGAIESSKFQSYINGGCSQDLSMPWSWLLTIRMGGGYTLKNFTMDSMILKTNTQSNTAFRGFGGPEGILAIELAIEKIAHTLDKRPEEVRKLNLTKDGDLLHVEDHRVQGCSLQQCWVECEKVLETKRLEVESFNRANVTTKRGLAMVPMKFDPTMGAKMVQQGVAFVRIFKDGSVLVSHGGTEMGQGLHTKMIQVASKALDVDYHRIHIKDTASDITVNASPTGGSTGADLNGPAVIEACETLKERLQPLKLANPDFTWEQVVMTAYLERVNLSAVGFYDKSEVNFDFSTNSGRFSDYHVYGVGLVVSEVYMQTGQVTVLSADIFMDCGKSLNPAIDIGQIEGGFLQGLGYVTNEQLLMDPNTGQLLTNGPNTYKIPTVADVPKEMNVKLIKNHKGGPTSAVYSSKGIGEAPLLLGCAGVYCSIRQAIYAYRKSLGNQEWFDLSVPATPDRIRMAAEDEALAKMITLAPGVPDEEKYAIEM